MSEKTRLEHDEREPQPDVLHDLRRLSELGFAPQQAAALVFLRAWWRPRQAAECRGSPTTGRKRSAG